ncbi:protein of unknown function [Aminobacter niigataensis]|nr:protein of unknown function [Aminobacter niigataensis]
MSRHVKNRNENNRSTDFVFPKCYIDYGLWANDRRGMGHAHSVV